MSGLCFQMRADVENVDSLLNKIRATALTDYMRLDLNGDGDTDDVISMTTNNGSTISQPETQPLQLINPGGFFRKYLLPENLPTEVHPSGTVALEKGFYKGVIFNIPGAQVKVNGTWMAFDASNAALIKAQNPFTLEWRIDGSLCQQYGYTEGQTISGTVISVDDEWNGLTDLGKTFTVKLTSAATGIQTLDSDATTTTVYNLQGMKVATVPSVNGTPQLQTLPKGIYIINGKVIIR